MIQSKDFSKIKVVDYDLLLTHEAGSKFIIPLRRLSRNFQDASKKIRSNFILKEFTIEWPDLGVSEYFYSFMGCPVCKGAGYYTNYVKYKYTGIERPVRERCLCQRAKEISKIGLFNNFEDQFYFPFDRIHKKIQMDPNEWKHRTIPNFIFYGENRLFLCQMKSFIMKHYQSEKSMSVYIDKSIMVVHDFLLPPKGSKTGMNSIGLQKLIDFDLVILLFGSEEKNEALQPCIREVVSSRLLYAKPTWIYSPTIDFLSLREYSDELKQYTDKFSQINLDDLLDGGSIDSERRSKNIAADF